MTSIFFAMRHSIPHFYLGWRFKMHCGWNVRDLTLQLANAQKMQCLNHHQHHSHDALIDVVQNLQFRHYCQTWTRTRTSALRCMIKWHWNSFLLHFFSVSIYCSLLSQRNVCSKYFWTLFPSRLWLKFWLILLEEVNFQRKIYSSIHFEEEKNHSNLSGNEREEKWQFESKKIITNVCTRVNSIIITVFNAHNKSYCIFHFTCVAFDLVYILLLLLRKKYIVCLFAH